MSPVRRHLRRGVFAWLVCHALTFTALFPRDCCALHAHGTPAGGNAVAVDGDAPPCHETPAAPAPGAHCEMAAADGAACPMHRTGAAPADCQMSGLCDAPASALAAVVLQPAVLVRSGLAVPAVSTQVAMRPPDGTARSLAVPPDSPPPRL